jgi:hypothetical protein
MQIRHFVSVAVGLMCLVVVAVNAQADPIVVNCDQGQSLNRTLARMNKATQVTVLVKGTCTEYVRINGLDGLTLKGSEVRPCFNRAKFQAMALPFMCYQSMLHEALPSQDSLSTPCPPAWRALRLDKTVRTSVSAT